MKEICMAYTAVTQELDTFLVTLS